MPKIMKKSKVIERNSAVLEIANKHKLQVIDLYSEIFGNEHLIAPDKIHPIEEGYKKLAKVICRYII